MLSLQRILEHEVLGQRSRFERYAAEMIYVMASGQHIDPERSPKFGEILERIYTNPFEKAKKKMTAEEIRQYTIKRITELRDAIKGN